MSLSMYQASVPVFARMLTNLERILQKADEHAQARKIDPTALLKARLYPDMFDLTRQVQIATDFARRTTARLSGREAPAFEDNETTFADLVARVQRSRAYVESAKRQDIDGSEERELVVPMRNETRRFKGQSYLLDFSLPHFFFHVTTAYDILRHNGVELGKSDYIGPLD